ncbi:MAG: cupin domain-containing protein [Treponema sp.]|jgi:mannose-6-phosphate isomerase-like protein (cupin superfamily)|nr:cupin domain-containing protein [Treponema sp.]
MVIHRNEMKTDIREKMRDGEGSVRFVHLADASAEKNTRLLAELCLEPGCSIGYHEHKNETEYFFIISGTGIVNDNGTEVMIKAGDATLTGNGASHSIKNTGNVPLVFHAVIVTH